METPPNTPDRGLSPLMSPPDNKRNCVLTVLQRKSAPIGKWKLNFGKYKGLTYEEVKRDDLKYLKYMLEQGTFNNEQYAETNTKIKEYILA